jgi:hypothetical protein
LSVNQPEKRRYINEWGFSSGSGRMSKQPKRDEPEIKLPTPDVQQEPVEPEIPPDKDTPEKEGPTKAG